MKLLSGFISLALLSATIVSSIPVTRRDVDESLVPQFGFSAGVNPTGTGDCDGAVNGSDGQPVKVPCSCPPDRATFIQSLNANVAAGNVVNNPSVPISFPGDNSTASQLARINAATVTLQNLNGSGQGCPVASTTFQAQAAAINNANSDLSSAPSPTSAINVTSIHPQAVEAILMARQFSSDASLIPTFSAVNPIASTPVITVSGLVSLQSSAPVISVSNPIASTITTGISESAISPIPTATASRRLPPLLEDILKARQLAPINSLFPEPNEFILLKARDDSEPTPTVSIPLIIEDILARQSTPSPSSSPSPKPEIILVGPPIIERR